MGTLLMYGSFTTLVLENFFMFAIYTKTPATKFQKLELDKIQPTQKSCFEYLIQEQQAGDGLADTVIVHRGQSTPAKAFMSKCVREMLDNAGASSL